MVELTNGVPICPHCKKPTRRMASFRMASMVFKPAMWDEDGKRIEQHMDMYETYKCLECNNSFKVFGNRHDGYEYKDI